MASKIFMGDMPELMENILNNLNNELDSLYSCALVSRHWCKMSVPILWQNPFSFEKTQLIIFKYPFSFEKRPLIIPKYFSSLDEDEKLVLKECLKEYWINTEFSKTLFNYASFLKALDLSRLESNVKKWIEFQLSSLSSDSYYLSSTPVYRIIKLLFRLFLRSGTTLHKLDLDFPDYEINPEFFCSLEQNEQFFSRLQNLSLNLTPFDKMKNATTLLKTLAKYTTKISALKFDGFYSDFEPQLFHILISVIKSQEQLRKFSLVGVEELPLLMEYHGVISALESQKNSLQEVIIENCAYNAEFEILNNCKKLEIFRSRYCDYPNLLKILNNKISTLEILDFGIDASDIVEILEKCGILLQRLKLESGDDEIVEEPLLLESLKSFCPNITYLDILNFRFSTQLLEFIGSLQKLQFLSLWCFDEDIPVEELKIRVIQFAGILPLSLQYLDLRDDWLDSYVDIFLDHCNTPLKKLLIFRLGAKKNTKALIEFCMRNRTLSYVGVSRYIDLNDEIKKELVPYVTLVPYERIVIDC